jgi:hypothetical protein
LWQPLLLMTTEPSASPSDVVPPLTVGPVPFPVGPPDSLTSNSWRFGRLPPRPSPDGSTFASGRDQDLLTVQPRRVVDIKLVAILVLPVHYAQMDWPHVCRKPPGATRPPVDLRYL